MSESENGQKPEEVLAQTENKEEKKIVGILTSEAAHRLNCPEAANKPVEFKKNKNGTATTEVFFNGELIGKTVELGERGIVEN